MAEYGIKETKEMFAAAVGVVDAYRISRADDGKITIPQDLINFIQPLSQIPVAVDGADMIPKELGDLDDVEIMELTDDFGDLVQDERYKRVFYGLAIAGDAIKEIVNAEQPEQPEVDPKA